MNATVKTMHWAPEQGAPQQLFLLFHGVGANAADIQASELEALQGDPQVQQITQLAAALQLPTQQLQTALGMGAAVQRALQQASTQFEELLQQALTAKLLHGTQRPLLIKDSP